MNMPDGSCCCPCSLAAQIKNENVMKDDIIGRVVVPLIRVRRRPRGVLLQRKGRQPVAAHTPSTLQQQHRLILGRCC